MSIDKNLGYDPVAYNENIQWLKEREAQRLAQPPPSDPNAAVQVTREHREQARGIVQISFPPDANPEAQWTTDLIDRIASALSSRDPEIREVQPKESSDGS